MKRRTFIGLGLGLLVGGGVVVRQALEQTDRGRLFELVNVKRAQRGRPPVVWNLELARRAQAWAAHMAEVGVLEHSRVKVPAGGDWVGEIIGVGDSFRQVMAAWIDSDPHRQILLFRRARFAGAGAVHDGQRWWLDVQFSH